MVGLVDIAPVTSTVSIRGQDIIITGVSARGIALLLARFPKLRAVMTGREVALDDLLKRKRRLHPIGYPSFAVTAEERVSF